MQNCSSNNMYQYGVLLIILALIGARIQAGGQVPSLQELAVQIVMSQDLKLADLPGYFEYLNIDLDELPLKVQQAFVSAIKDKFGAQLDSLFVTTLISQNDITESMVVSSDNKYIITNCKDHTLKVYDLQTGQLIHTFSINSWGTIHVINTTSKKYLVAGSEVNTDSKKYIIASSEDCTIKEWDIVTSKLTHSNFNSLVRSALTLDSEHIVVGCVDNTAKIWNATTDKFVHTLVGHSDTVSSLAVSSNGSYIVTGSWDKTVKVWYSKTGQLLCTLSGHDSSVIFVAVNLDNNSIVIGYSDNTVKVCDMRYFTNTLKLSGLIAHIKERLPQQ